MREERRRERKKGRGLVHSFTKRKATASLDD
jgi:hypothetical protein